MGNDSEIFSPTDRMLIQPCSSPVEIRSLREPVNTMPGGQHCLLRWWCCTGFPISFVSDILAHVCWESDTNGYRKQDSVCCKTDVCRRTSPEMAALLEVTSWVQVRTVLWWRSCWCGRLQYMLVHYSDQAMEVVSSNVYGSESHWSAQSPYLVTSDLFCFKWELKPILDRCGSLFHTHMHVLICPVWVSGL